MGTLQRNVIFEPFQSVRKNFVPDFIFLILRFRTKDLKTFFQNVLWKKKVMTGSRLLFTANRNEAIDLRCSSMDWFL